MFFDQSLLLSNAQVVTTTAASTTIYDVTGAGSGNAPSMVWGGAAGTFGDDIGSGDGAARPVAYFTVGTSFAGGTSMVISVQAAPDNGSNAPGTYVTLTETAVLPVADLLAGTTISLPIPSIPSTVASILGLPRFYRFNYTVVGTMSGGGTITGGILLNPTSSVVSRQYNANYTAA